MHLTVYLVSARNKSSAVAQHAQIEYKVSAGKDGDRLVKLISLSINSLDKCI